MIDTRYFFRLNFKIVPLIFILMGISLLVISSVTSGLEEAFLSMYVKSQIKWFILGWAVFILCSVIDYTKIREWTWFLYVFMLFMLLGVFFTSSINNVHRWYCLPIIGMNVQPSEFAKLIVVLSLGWLLEKNSYQSFRYKVVVKVLFLVGIPFFLILKQPDLGTALVLFPIMLVMSFLGNLHKGFIRLVGLFSLIGGIFIALIYLDIVSHEQMKPIFTKFLKEYQYERLNPNTYHQRASKTAIAIGGMTGSGWKQSNFSGKKWLPAAHTDSVFSAFGEQFGLIGMFFLFLIYGLLIFFSFQVAEVAKDLYGKLLASGLAVYLSMHILLNIGMMCGILPISGVPLVLITYGGSSTLVNMAALGILQNIYSKRFMF